MREFIRLFHVGKNVDYFILFLFSLGYDNMDKHSQKAIVFKGRPLIRPIWTAMKNLIMRH